MVTHDYEFKATRGLGVQCSAVAPWAKDQLTIAHDHLDCLETEVVAINVPAYVIDNALNPDMRPRPDPSGAINIARPIKLRPHMEAILGDANRFKEEGTVLVHDPSKMHLVWAQGLDSMIPIGQCRTKIATGPKGKSMVLEVYNGGRVVEPGQNQRCELIPLVHKDKDGDLVGFDCQGCGFVVDRSQVMCFNRMCRSHDYVCHPYS